jgi:hypothetical protein
VVCIVASLRRSTRPDAPWLIAVFAFAVTAFWVVKVAPGTGHYLLPVLGSAYHETVSTILGHTSTRALFGGSTGAAAPGTVAPYWQRLTALASVGLIAVVVPFGLLEVRGRFQSSAVALALGAAAVAYIAVLPARLIPAAWETSNRSSEFFFIGVAATVALVPQPSWLPRRVYALVAAGFVAVLLIGGIVAGWPPRVLLAQPTRGHAADGHVIVAQPEAVAVWARTVLKPGHRFIAPEAIGRELLDVGRQTVWVTSAPFDASTVLYDSEITSGIASTLATNAISYVAEDVYTYGDDNMSGYFFPNLDDEQRFPAADRLKFDAYPGVDRVLDSGAIMIYDVRALSVAP